VKHAGLPQYLPSQNMTWVLWLTEILYWALIGATQLLSSDHVAPIKEAKVELQEHKVLENNLKLEFLVSHLSCDVRRTILRGKETG
jgi:hypothetical protein